MTTPQQTVEPVPSLEMKAGQRRLYRGIRKVLTGGAKVWFRAVISGVENIPDSGAFILAPGAHRSIIDTPLVAVAVPNRELRYMGAENYFDIPVLGSFLRSMGGFPVDREANDRAAMRLAEQVLAQGEPLVVFPEGTRRSGPVIEDTKQGAAFLACRANVPLIPVGIGGAERSFPIGGRMVKPTKVAMVIGEPIIPPSREEGQRVKRSTITTVSAQLNDQLQILFDQAQAAANAL